MKLIVYTDGGSRGNPGPGAIGIVVKNVQGKTIKEIGKFIGKSTNNEAEYKAVIEALKLISDKKSEDKADQIDFFIDSLLVVNQLNGDFRVKDKKIKIFWNEVKNLERNFKKIIYTHIPRTKNYEADRVVNEVLDSL